MIGKLIDIVHAVTIGVALLVLLPETTLADLCKPEPAALMYYI